MTNEIRQQVILLAASLLEDGVSPGELSRELRRVADDLDKGVKRTVRAFSATLRAQL